ncbi:GreA/GreB family elongation factor [Patescibacteria group bacterium]|nr:GreA/GreB family elongation factor [Patescibacteria group bacterium]MBU1895753.1 GreA/GreB family elongation factor [Patescibacteria group bacterium]
MQLPKRKPGKYSQIAPDHIMTEEKRDELEQELQNVKKKRSPAAKEVARLAELGDFSENVEYQLAKGRLRGINSAILRLEYRINHADLIKKNKSGKIQIGSTVTVKTPKSQKIYTILGASESSPSKGIISHLSPLGSALLGHKVGDVVNVEKVGECKVLEAK